MFGITEHAAQCKRLILLHRRGAMLLLGRLRRVGVRTINAIVNAFRDDHHVQAAALRTIERLLLTADLVAFAQQAVADPGHPGSVGIPCASSTSGSQADSGMTYFMAALTLVPFLHMLPNHLGSLEISVNRSTSSVNSATLYSSTAKPLVNSSVSGSLERIFQRPGLNS